MNTRFLPDGLRNPRPGFRSSTGSWWWTIAALAAVFVFALFLRLDNLVRWQELPHAYFVDDAPMLLNVDGYYYLDLARDLVEGNYKPVDLDRVVPDGRPRPLPPPLLPVLTASVQKLSGASFEWVGVVLPAVVGAFIVLPVFALGYRLGGGVMALVAAFAAAASPHYLQRTTLGWFDTDGLVVVLPLAIARALMRFAETGGAHRWRYLAAAVVFEMIMLWWWDYGLGPSLAAFLLPFAVAVFLYPHDRMTRRWLVAVRGCSSPSSRPSSRGCSGTFSASSFTSSRSRRTSSRLGRQRLRAAGYPPAAAGARGDVRLGGLSRGGRRPGVDGHYSPPSHAVPCLPVHRRLPVA
ncbi:MAG: hypothetical protein M5U09_07760 [Gammaproteobacteria bacterium]|nr:hypothetical protein [Gammaproteobacteria bacterium]